MFDRMRVIVSLFLVVLPISVPAQAPDVTIPPTVPVPTDWRTALWTLIVVPAAAWIWQEVVRWLAARRLAASAQATATVRGSVESMLYSLADSVGGPFMQAIIPDFMAALNPSGPGGMRITQEEMSALEKHVEEQLRALLTKDNLNLVMRTIGLPAAVRLLATFLLRRVFAVRETAANEAVPTDPAMVYYGRTADEVASEPTGG